MKDLRMEVIRVRIKQGRKYTALFNTDPDDADRVLRHLDGKRVTIKNIRTDRYGYGLDIVEDMFPVFPYELSEWREE